MVRLFDGLISKKTYINTTFHCQAIISENHRNIPYLCNPRFNPCETVEDIQFVYQWINLELRLLHSKIYDHVIFNIKLSGRLNGNVVNEEFTTLNEYQLFLENIGILQPSEMLTPNYN